MARRREASVRLSAVKIGHVDAIERSSLALSQSEERKKPQDRSYGLPLQRQQMVSDEAKNRLTAH